MKQQKYKKSGNRGLFNVQDTYQKLSAIGNPLEMTSKVVDFEIFREVLGNYILNQNKKNNAGANPYDVVMMFKILILQRYYGLGETQIEYQILDRLSFKMFLGLDNLLAENDKGQDFYADSAYTGDVQEKVISKYKMENKVHEKGYR